LRAVYRSGGACLGDGLAGAVGQAKRQEGPFGMNTGKTRMNPERAIVAGGK